jgi:hypothetical protein
MGDWILWRHPHPGLQLSICTDVCRQGQEGSVARPVGGREEHKRKASCKRIVQTHTQIQNMHQRTRERHHFSSSPHSPTLTHLIGPADRNGLPQAVVHACKHGSVGRHGAGSSPLQHPTGPAQGERADSIGVMYEGGAQKKRALVLSDKRGCDDMGEIRATERLSRMHARRQQGRPHILLAIPQAHGPQALPVGGQQGRKVRSEPQALSVGFDCTLIISGVQ